MHALRTLINQPLDRLSYFVTIYAVGLAGLALIWQRPPFAHALWLTGLILVYMALSSFSMSPRIHNHKPRIHALLSLQTGLVTALVLLEPETNFFIIWFYLQTVYALITLPMREAYVWLALFTLGTLGLLVNAYGWLGGMTGAIVYTSGFIFFWAFANLTRRAHAAREESERLLAELQQAHRSLQEYAAKAEALAVAEERNRLAREMHDTLGHRLTVSAVQLEAAERLIPSQPQRAAEMVATVRGQVRAALHELRQTVAALRQPLEDNLPLERALPRLVTDFQQAAGLPVHLDMPAALPPLTPRQRLTLFRAAQEGLTNIHKHAAAARAWVRLEAAAGRITLQVADDGRGPQDDGRGGFGLRGLEERAQVLGGALRFGPRPQGGTLLEITLPLDGGEASPPPQEV